MLKRLNNHLKKLLKVEDIDSELLNIIDQALIDKINR